MEESVNPDELLLFVDTETTGIPNDETRSYKDIDNWPSICQISWLIYDKYGKRLSERNYYTKCQSSDYASIDDEWNKITPIHEVLPEFLGVIPKCAVIVGHNIQYDVNVILCELYRLGLDTAELEKLPQFCTMQNGVAACSFETTHGARYPKLQELYTKLFHRPFQNAHNSYYDITATADCFWELFNKGYLNKYDYLFLLDGNMKRELFALYVKRGKRTIETYGENIRNDKADDASPNIALAIFEKALECCSDKDSTECVAEILYQAALKTKGLRGSSFALFLEKSAELKYCPAIITLAYETTKNNLRESLLKKALLFNYYRAALLLYRHYLLMAEDSEYKGLSSLLNYHANKYLRIWENYCNDNFDSLDSDDVSDYIRMFLYGENGKTIDLDKAKSLCQRALSNGTDVNLLMERIFEKREEPVEQFNFLLKKWTEYVNHYFEETGNRIYYAYKVFHCYFDGYGTAKDYTKAKKVLENIHFYYFFQQNKYRHMYEYKIFPTSIQEQLFDLFFYVGQYFEYGWADTPIDYAKANECYRKCSCNGISQASIRLGELLLYGKGCKPNYDEALRLFRVAEYHGLNVQNQIQLAQKAIMKKRLHRVFKFLCDPQKYLDAHKT